MEYHLGPQRWHWNLPQKTIVLLNPSPPHQDTRIAQRLGGGTIATSASNGYGPASVDFSILSTTNAYPQSFSTALLRNN